MDNLSLHYGTDPILGFHLATACAPLVDSSPLNPTQTDAHGLKPAVKASRQQFEAWCSAFRSRSRQLTLRFFVGEALTLCHALQQNLTAADDAAHWYRAPYQPDPLILDSHDYTSGQAPLTFNVIDTSNLIDHFGSINLLVAAAPLLDNGLAANLVTEFLLRRYDSNQPPMDGLLCGNFNALSIVLGLFPVQHWTNTSSTSPLYGSILTVCSSDFGKDTATQLHSRLTWKNHIPADTLGNVILHCSEEDLARLLYQTYLTMFEGEDPNVLTAKRNARHVRNISMPYYTRASYAAFLRFVKARVESDWSKVFAMLLNFIDNDTNLMLGRNFLQELRVQMHLFGVSAGLIPDVSLDERARTHREAAQLAWNPLPNLVSVTLKVPRSKLRVFSEVPRERLGTPPLNCHVVTPTGRSTFAAIHLTFGTEKFSGVRNTGSFTLDIQQDSRGWNDDSALWISFLAPTALLLVEPQNASVQCTLQPTSYTIKSFGSRLDEDLTLFKSSLGDSDHVFIRCRLNMVASPAVLPELSFGRYGDVSEQNEVHVNVFVDFEAGTAQLSNLTGRLDLISDDLKAELSSGAVVDTIQVSAYVIAVKIRTSQARFEIYYPVPVLKSQNKIRVARKSSYIGVIVPAASPSMKHYFPDFIHPSFPGSTSPMTWNAPHLPLSRLPVIDTTADHDKQWLARHLTSMWSARERQLRESSLGSTPNNPEVRIALKDSVLTILSHFARAATTTITPLFALANPAGGGVHILILASALRLDLSHQSVVLDAACVPLTPRTVQAAAQVLRRLQSHPCHPLCQVDVDARELRAWKTLLPALVERARTWSHVADCAYNSSGIPVSLEDGTSPLCACGAGVFPEGFFGEGDLKECFEGLRGWAVRVAVAPIFSSPTAEVQDDGLGGGLGGGGALGGGSVRAGKRTGRCGVCGKAEKVGGGELLRCSRCKKVRYCSPECQKRDWKRHKVGCVAAAASEG